jgi:tetratricopeptide (TPR) repeat protein
VRRTSRTGNDIFLDYQYRSLAAEIPVAKLRSYLAEREQARKDTSFEFWYSPPQSNGKSDVVKATDALARALVAAKASDMENTERELRSVMDSPGFAGLTDAQQRAATLLAGAIATEKRDWPRALTMSQRACKYMSADENDWMLRVNAGTMAGDWDDASQSLTTVAERWSTALHKMQDTTISRIVGKLESGSSNKFRLLSGLNKAAYERQDGVDLSFWWRDLVLLQVERGEIDEARRTLGKIAEPYALVSILADNRFAPIRAALSEEQSIPRAVENKIARLRARVQKQADKLAPTVSLGYALMESVRFSEMLQVSDAAIERVKSPTVAKTFSDYGEQFRWILDNRGRALRKLGRWDEYVAQLEEANKHPGDHADVVSHRINLASAYADLGRPKEARALLEDIDEHKASPYGNMQVAGVRLLSAALLGETAEVDRLIGYMHDHKDEALETYQEALLNAGHLDEAAQLLVSRIMDTRTRLGALMEVQQYTEVAELPPGERKLKENWRTVLASPEVQDAIRKVGVVSSYDLLPELT